MSNVAVIRQIDNHIEVWDNFGQAQDIPLQDGKLIEDEMNLLRYVIEYAQNFGDDTVVDILDAVCEKSLKMIISTIPYANEQVMPIFIEMGFWEE